ncbi:MAG: response regulator transcription factor [Ignavibacteriales bacterium]|nr:response regulator transcription factor [Ignavibacteriales bacterium]
MINLAIVGRDGVLKNGLKYLAEQTDGLNCTAILNNYEELSHIFQKENPGVLLIDIDIAPEKAFKLISEIKEKHPQTLMLVLSGSHSRDIIYKALQCGAAGFLLDDTSPLQLIQAVQDVYEGGAPLSSKAARNLVDYFQENNTNLQTKDYSLSSREKEVLGTLINGKNVKDIAGKLFISIDTVRFHFKNIYRKLNVRNQAELVAKVLREKII